MREGHRVTFRTCDITVPFVDAAAGTKNEGAAGPILDADMIIFAFVCHEVRTV